MPALVIHSRFLQGQQTSEPRYSKKRKRTVSKSKIGCHGNLKGIVKGYFAQNPVSIVFSNFSKIATVYQSIRSVTHINTRKNYIFDQFPYKKKKFSCFPRSVTSTPSSKEETSQLVSLQSRQRKVGERKEGQCTEGWFTSLSKRRK